MHSSMFAEAMAHSMKVYKLFMGADGLSNYSTWPRTFQVNSKCRFLPKLGEQIQFSSILYIWRGWPETCGCPWQANNLVPPSNRHAWNFFGLGETWQIIWKSWTNSVACGNLSLLAPYFWLFHHLSAPYRMAPQAAAWLECPLIWSWSWRFNSVSNTDMEVNCSRRIQNAFFYPTLSPTTPNIFQVTTINKQTKKMSISVILSKKYMHFHTKCLSNLQQNSTKAYKWKK